MNNNKIDWLLPDISEIKRYIGSAVDRIKAHDQMKRIIKDVMGNPGKMIRPVMMLLAAGEYEEICRDELLSAAAAVEMIHSSSLILDDMIDDSPLRRGKPTVQHVFGKGIALCSGDYLMVAAISDLYDRGYPAAARELMEVIQIACDGEMIQNENVGNIHVRREDYEKAIGGKTAYFFRSVCGMACRITGKSESVKKNLEEFGEILGTVFQIKDDLLDWTREESEIGKPINEDFSEGIYTLPAIYTFSKEGYGEKLKEYAVKDSLTKKDLHEIRRIVREAGGIKYTEAYLRELCKRAEELIDTLPASDYPQKTADAMRYLIDKIEKE